MFTAIVVHITPVEETTAPAHTGKAIQAWFLNLVRAHDPRLSKGLHEDSGPRPYTVSDAVGLGPICNGRRMLSPERSGWLRVATLTSELSVLLTECIVPMLPGAMLDLSRAMARIDGVATTPTEHPWAGRASPQALLTAGSLSAEMPRRLTMRFASPTTFKSQGVNVPFPLPDLVFGSLLNRWNAHAPVALHVDTRRFAEAQVVASKFDLRSKYISIDGGEGGAAVGCVGKCRYYIQSSDKYWIGVIRTLATYAFFAGVGARTATGMGQATLWDEDEGRPVSITPEQGDGI